MIVWFKKSMGKIGWVTYESFVGGKRKLEQYGYKGVVSEVRCKNIALWLNKNSEYKNEVYDPKKKYDIVIFVKMMDEKCQVEARKIKKYGSMTIFDANVNYFEVWGDYFVPGTKPTYEQNRDAIAMASICDVVIADSSYIASVVRKYNNNVVMIPDAVDMNFYKGRINYVVDNSVNLVWSGVAKKSAHLEIVVDVLKKLSEKYRLKLILVSDERPEIMGVFQKFMECEWVEFSHQNYLRELKKSNIIISPKKLSNAYEMGHTEYKITLGMALGLPAVASPQGSYKEAIGFLGGGIIASTEDDWVDALEKLITNDSLMKRMGGKARDTVVKKYSVEVISKRYRKLFGDLLVKNANVN
ncbi:MAG: glycosyltransferase [Candidatus Shapirobacteria bacterium]